MRKKKNSGSVDNNSPDLDLVYDAGNSNLQKAVGLRFTKLNIPKNANISKAFIQFRADGTHGNPILLNIHGEDAVHPVTYLENTNNLTNRAKTQSFSTWNPSPWIKDEMNGNQKWNGLGEIVQELVNKSDWEYDSAISFIITGTDPAGREAESYDHDDLWRNAYLYIEYDTELSCLDDDNDGYCNEDDLCPDFDDQLIGLPCDDGNVCTSGEFWQIDCSCGNGVMTDSDNDGYCAGEDPDDEDPCVPNISHPLCTVECFEISSDDFESSWGIWNDGGSDCRRSSKDKNYANSGNYCIRLRDNSGSSKLTSDAIDLSSFNEINVHFSFIANSMEDGEDFFLEYSLNGGSSYHIIQEWNASQEFNNGIRYHEAVNISGITFSNNSMIRFRCDASSNADKIYIDDILIEGCGLISNFNRDHLNSAFKSGFNTGVSLFPNPLLVGDVLTVKVENPGNSVEMQIYHIDGRKVQHFQFDVITAPFFTWDQSNLESGTYFVVIKTEFDRYIEKMVILR